MFHVRPDSFAEQHVAFFGQVLEDQYSFAVDSLALNYSGRIAMFLYDSPKDAGRELPLSGTAYPATEAVKVVVMPPLDDRLLAELAHEANHVVIINGLGRPGTTFVSEGLASGVLSERYHRLGKQRLYPWTAANESRLPALRDLIDDDKWGSFDQESAYNASASFLAYLLETYGANRLRRLYPMSSEALVQGFAAIYDRPLDQAEVEWRRFCATR